MSALPQPAPASPSEPSPDLVANGPASGPRSILLVDDEAHVLRVLRLSLDRNGYEVDTALNGEVALALLGERSYAALIIGAHLAPGGHGLCDSVRRRLGELAPLMLVMDEATPSPADDWSELPIEGVERVERPVSLRWIVARLNEYFGAYGDR